MKESVGKAKLFLLLDVSTLIEAGERLVRLARFYDLVKVGRRRTPDRTGEGHAFAFRATADKTEADGG